MDCKRRKKKTGGQKLSPQTQEYRRVNERAPGGTGCDDDERGTLAAVVVAGPMTSDTKGGSERRGVRDWERERGVGKKKRNRA